MRLIFVSDEIPTELRCIVEFLNQQMDPAEVLAVEIKQYVGGDLKTLVPRVIGQTVEAQQKKTGAIRGGKQWDETSFFKELEARRGTNEAEVAKRIFEWSHTRATYIWWGEGKTSGSFVPMLMHKGRKHQLFAVWTYGVFEFYFQYYQYKPPLNLKKKDWSC